MLYLFIITKIIGYLLNLYLILSYSYFHIIFNIQYLSLQIYFLYLNNDCIIRFTNTQEITIILKQNSENMYKVSYYNNIKWQNNLPHEMTRNINAIDIVRFYPLAGTDVFLAEIIGQNY